MRDVINAGPMLGALDVWNLPSTLIVTRLQKEAVQILYQALQ